MAKEYGFLPDPGDKDHLDKLLLSQRQRFGLVRWLLFSAATLVALLVQDVAGYRVHILGSGIDIVPCVIFMITALQGAENGSIYALLAAVFYYLSGSAPGAYVIPLITVIAVLVAILRQAVLRRGIFSILVCAACAMLVYEMCIFAIGLILEQTVSTRIFQTVLTALVSLLAVPVAYPVLRAIGKIGGEPWKE